MTPDLKTLPGVKMLVVTKPLAGARIDEANIRPVMGGQPIADRMTPIAWDATARSLPNAAPVLLGGEVASRMSNVFSVGFEQRQGEGDERVIAVGHLEVEADEAVAAVIVEPSDLDGIRAVGGDDDFSHLESFRASRGGCTIAEGGAVAHPGLNSRDRTAGGRA